MRHSKAIAHKQRAIACSAVVVMHLDPRGKWLQRSHFHRSVQASTAVGIQPPGRLARPFVIQDVHERYKRKARLAIRSSARCLSTRARTGRRDAVKWNCKRARGHDSHCPQEITKRRRTLCERRVDGLVGREQLSHLIGDVSVHWRGA